MYKYANSISFGGFNEVKKFSEQEMKEWYIINVSKRLLDSSDEHIPLNDGIYDGGNSQEKFAKAANSVRKKIDSNENVFVHCAVGQSRSVTILATAIAAETDMSFENVRDELINIRGITTEPASSLQSKAKVYLRHTS